MFTRRGGGLLGAAVLTLTGTYGSLVGVLVTVVDIHLSDGAKLVVWIGCILAVLLVASYAINTLRRLLDAATDDAAGALERLPRLTGAVSLSCCGSRPDAVDVRVYLL